MSDGSMNGDTETIFAVASGSVPAGVAVLRLSGPGAGKALADMAGGLPAARRASVRRLRDPEGELLDEALVLWFPGPASFTGEDVVELHLHGGRATVAAVTAALGGRDDFRPAEAGEFTRRAFYNGRLDLTQVEGLADLVAAETEAQRRLAQRQSGGEAARRFDGWRNRVIALSAQVEASLDFADEDLPETLLDDMRDKILGLVEEITQNMDHEGRGERLRTGLQIAILGAPNVGKSSLLNRMARRDVAIVSAQAGTTRDVVEVHLDLGGWPVTIADTAGLRLTGDEVEKEGIRRAHARAGLSDLRLCIFDASAGDPFDDATRELAGSESVAVLNKCDMVSARRLADLERRAVSELGAAAAVGLSARTGTGMARLESVLEEFARQSMDQGQGCLLTRARHRVALRECTDSLGRAVAGMDTAVGTELVAEDLRLAARALGRITGRIDVEDVLDRVFSEFCIGK